MIHYKTERWPEHIANDERKIESIVLEPPYSFIVGKEDVEKIQPYLENGEMATITWFAIYSGSKIIARVNSKYVVTVYYFN